MSEQGIREIWPHGRPLIGMVHLLPLPGAPGWGGSMDEVVDRAVTDARVLTAAGFDGVMVENYGDAPFFRGEVPPETVAALTRAVVAVRRETNLPVGVNVLRNDARGALGIAVSAGARFIRVNVHTGSMWTDQGLVQGRAAETVRARAALAAEVAILADVHVKHATPVDGATIGMAAADSWERGRADALIVSGVGTGSATQLTDVQAVRAVVPDAPILIGSGTTHENVRQLMTVADGAIVGSFVMTGGEPGTAVNPKRAQMLVQAARG